MEEVAAAGYAETELRSLEEKYIADVVAWAEQNNRVPEKVLESRGQSLFKASGRYRKKHSHYNYYRAKYKQQHREIADAELAESTAGDVQLQTVNTPGYRGREVADRINQVGLRMWRVLKENPEKMRELHREFDAALVSETCPQSANVAPRTPTKVKNRFVAQSRLSSIKTIRHLIKGVILYAEDNSFDVAVYIADRNFLDYGGLPPEQLGTTGGVKFISTAQAKGISVDWLQIIAQSSHANLNTDYCTSGGHPAPLIGPADPLEDAFPSLARTTLPNGQNQVQCGNKHGLNQMIRTWIRDGVNRLVKEESQKITKVPGDASKFSNDLLQRNIEVQFSCSCEVNLVDLCDYKATTVKLQKVYAALVLSQVTFVRSSLTTDSREVAHQAVDV